MMSDCSMLRHGWTGAKHRVSRMRRALVLTLLAGCGTLQNTPQQDATYARFQKCLDETHASAQLLRVHPSGDFQWQLTRAGAGNDDGGMQNCLSRRAREDRIKVDFEECRSRVYPEATLAELNANGTFRWHATGTSEANEKLKLCLKERGYKVELGASTLGVSLEQARQITAQFQGQTFTPPPRSVADLKRLLDSVQPNQANFLRSVARADAPPPTGEDDLALAHFYDRRGAAAGTLGRLEQRLDDLRLAAKHAAAIGMRYQDRRGILRELAFAEVVAGNYQSALAAVALARKIQPGVSITSSEIATRLYAAVGDLASARELERFVASSGRQQSASDPFQPWRVMQARVWILQAEGRWQEAEPYLRDIVTAMGAPQGSRRPTDPGPASPDQRLDLILVLAENLLEQRRPVEAEVVARAVLTSGLEIHGKQHPIVTQTLALLARILAAQRRFEDAETLSRISLSIVLTFGLPPGAMLVAQAHHDLGRALGAQHKWADATVEFDLARAELIANPEIYEGLYGHDLDVPLALAMSGRAAEAVTRLREAYDFRIRNFPKGHPQTDETFGLLALARRRAGDSVQALADFQLAVPPLLRGTLEHDAGGAGLGDRTRTILEEYLDLLLEQGDRQSLIEAFRIADAARGGTVQRALLSSGARAAAGNPALADLVRREQDAVQQLAVVEGRLAAYMGTRLSERPQALIQSTRTEVTRLRAARVALRNEIAQRFPAYASLMTPSPPTMAQAQKALRSGEALLAVWLGPQRGAVWVIPREGESVGRVIPVSSLQIAESIRALRHAMDRSIRTLGEIPEFDLDLAHQLYLTLLAPVEPAWRDAKYLLVAPHGPLAQLPLSLLVTAPHSLTSEQENTPLFSSYRAVPWLARRVAVSQLPSVASLVTLRDLPPPPARRRPFVGFGDPWFSLRQAGHEGVDLAVVRQAPLLVPVTRQIAPAVRGMDHANLASLPPLPETADEVRSIASALHADPVADVFLGPRANEQMVMALDLSNRRVVVFATHGLVPGDLDGLTEPALALSAPEVAEVQGDGLLTMGKILGLRLNADWVVLSACNTAAADGEGAEAVSGLGRAFFYAGTRALLVSNWPVESTSARALTTTIFRIQAEKPMLTRADALRRAMLELIDGPGFVEGDRRLFSYAHPIFWAPFTLVGDGGATDLK